jgi:hypothetical protein
MRMAPHRHPRWIMLLAIAWLALVPASQAEAASAPPITVAFDHLPTGFELDGVHRDLPCESCHLNAVFKGTPRDCGTCHVKGSLFNATPKTTTHIPSTNYCAACHNTISFRPDAHFDHGQVLGSCVSCHNGSIAVGEGPNHPATSQDCASCHTVISWNPPKAVDHTQIPMAVAGFCIICHNGVQASGKPAGHVATNLECGDCHLTTTWLGATFDHTGITSGCVTCHNGTKAVGKQGNHMPTTNVCENCHTSGIGTPAPSWTPAIFDHTQMTVTTCQTCHSGSVKITTGFVSGQPSNHVPPIPSAIDCGVCHGNNPSAETWTMLAASIPTLHTGLPVSNCLMCHAGQTFAGVPAPYIPMSTSGVSPTKTTPLSPPHIPVLVGTDCSACHGAAYQAGGFGPATAMSAATHAFVSTACDTCHDTGKSFYVGGGTPLQLRPADHISSTDSAMATSDCSVCHETKDWVSSMMPAGHMPNPGNLTCAQCHASAPSDYTPATLAALTALHTGISGNCGLCHGNTTTALTWANNYTPKDALLTPAHIPYLTGTDCSSCHASNYVTGGFGPTNMSAAKHAFVPTSCATCHEAGLSFYLGASSPALQGRPADHMAPTGTAQQQTGDCSGCHETTDWNTTMMPTGHMPNPGNQACAVCHTAISSSAASYATLASISVLHTGISNGCGQCHGAFTQLSFYNNNDNPKDNVLTPPHIPYLNGADCSSCHAANYVAGGFGPTTMSAAKHAFVPTTCDSCHEAGLSFYLGASSPALQGRPADHMAPTGTAQQQTGDCSGCHETTDWNSTALPAGHMPNPGGQQCSTCHTAAPGNYVPLAGNAVLHTGITTGCAQCHGGAAALTFYNNNDNPKSGVLSPPHIPAFTGSDCSNCHTSTTYAVGGFGPMNMTQATHAAVGSTCNGCHEAGLSFYMGAASPGLQGRPADHTTGQQVAPNDCSLCHTTANWSTTVLPTGHMPNPGNQACNVCHTAAPTNYATLAANSVLHTGISSGCAQCHGATTQLTFYNNNDNPKDAVLTPPHIAYLAGTDCSACHSSTTYAAGGFGPMNMTQATHAFVATTCVTCHEAGVSVYMGAANPALQGRPADHTSGQMVAPNDCSICHTTANWNSTVLPAGHMPNPGNQACTVCHTKAPSDYTTATLAANAVLHTGITSGCITCHGAPNATPPVFYPSYTPKDAVLSPVHIPTSSTACESCHAISFTSFSGTTMSSAKHTSMFAVIGKTCDACHDLSTLKFYGVTNLTTRPNGHHVGQDCSGCHNTNNWDGGTQKRKPVAVAATSTRVTTVVGAQVASANSVNAALAANMSIVAQGIVARTATLSHAGVTNNCFSCHNGALASGKGAAHIASNSACQNCHTTIAWLPARFDHQGVTAICASCHNGVVASSKPSQHVQTTQDCGACHGSIAWNVATFSHLGVSATCRSCHNGLTAINKSGQHVVTTLDCGSCHNTLNWTVAASQAPGRRLLIPSPRAPKNGSAQ